MSHDGMKKHSHMEHHGMKKNTMAAPQDGMSKPNQTSN